MNETDMGSLAALLPRAGPAPAAAALLLLLDGAAGSYYRYSTSRRACFLLNFCGVYDRPVVIEIVHNVLASTGTILYRCYVRLRSGFSLALLTILQ